MSTFLLQALRTTRLRPTMPRIAILQVLESAGETQALDAEDIFQRVMARGPKAGLGTIYRVLHELERHGLLLREWGGGRKVMYRLKPRTGQSQALFMVCPHSGRRLEIVDPVLNDRLRAAASNLGLSLAGRRVLIEVDEAEDLEVN